MQNRKPVILRPKIEAPTEQEVEAAMDFLYPDYKGVYTDEQRTEINKLARELMNKRLQKQHGGALALNW